jgi:hypothetical protein
LLRHDKPFDERRRADMLLLGKDEHICFEWCREPDRKRFYLSRMDPLPSKELRDITHGAPPECTYREDL